MSQNYDNWERLVSAVLRKQHYLELCSLSEASSSEYSSSSRSLTSPLDDDLFLDVDTKGKQTVLPKWLPRLAGALKGLRLTKKAEQPHPGSSMVPRAAEGELIAAGWPPWLAEVSLAAEAVRGWVPRKADSFEILDLIGEGTYSNVTLARDSVDGKLVALKKVKFDILNPETVRFMAREIQILRRLDHPNVIKLEGLITSRMSSSLYLIFEYMEHDLAGLASHPEIRFSEPQVKCYMQQLLCGLDHCHGRDVLHRNINGSNLLIGSNGILKIAGFSSASFFDPHQIVPLTSRKVNLSYQPPELLLGSMYHNAGADLWSTGCMMAELYAGKPIMPGRTEMGQLQKIYQLCGSPSEEYWRKAKLPHTSLFMPRQPYERRVAETFKDFPAPAVALLEILLSIDPADRGSAASAVKSEYFMTRPYACDPSDLPKYPRSKELSANLGDEEAKREWNAGENGQINDFEKKESREYQTISSFDANAERIIPMPVNPFRVSAMPNAGQVVELQLSLSSTLKIQKGDITQWHVNGSSDAIVNPANELMLGNYPGFGTDGAIHQAAGPELREACYKVREVRPRVRCPTGEARITPGFRLPASHVIHAVGPIYYFDENSEALLRSAYRNSLCVAKENNIEYIGFTAISCGAYGYPYKEAAAIAISTVKEFANDFKEIHFVLFTDEIYDVWLNKVIQLLQK